MSTEATTKDQNIHGTALVNKQDPNTVITDTGKEQLPDGDATKDGAIKLTFGEQLVGVNVDPPDGERQMQIKMRFADIADVVNHTDSTGKGPHDFKKAALEAIKNACAMTIKHLCPRE